MLIFMPVITKYVYSVKTVPVIIMMIIQIIITKTTTLTHIIID